jgi:hypothetical protein
MAEPLPRNQNLEQYVRWFDVQVRHSGVLDCQKKLLLVGLKQA